MNVHPDMIRQQGPIPHLSQGMLNTMNSQHLFQQQQQQQQQQQPQPQPAHMALLQNPPNPNPSMAMPPGAQPNNPAPNGQGGLYPLHLQATNQQNRQQILMQQAAVQHAQSMVQRPGGPSNVNVNGINQHQLGMPFPNGMMPGQPLRRVVSQPQGLNQAGGHMGGMPQGGVAAIAGMGMTPQQAQMRHAVAQQHQQQQQQQQQQQLNMRMQQHHQQQQQQQQQMQGHMSPEMSMTLNRQPHMPVNAPMPPHVARGSSQAQLMNGMPQQSAIPQSHSGGMQQQMHQNAFSSSMNLPHQPHQPPIATSPHAGTQSQPHTPANLPAPNMVPPQASSSRSQVPSENPMYMGFQNPQMQQNMSHNVPRIPQNSVPYPFRTSLTPPNQDLPQAVGGQLMPSGSGARRTPAQLFETMSHPTENFPAPFNIPQPQPQPPASPRPPSHSASHGAFPVPPPPRTPMQTPLQHHGSPRTHPHPHPHPHPPEHIAPHHQMQRPQSQQGQQRQSPPQPGPSRTPRVSQAPLPMGAMNPAMNPAMIPPQPRIQPMPAPPHHQGAQAQPPPPTPAQPPMNIAPRPPAAQPAQPVPSTSAAPPPLPAQPEGPSPPQPQPATLPSNRSANPMGLLVGLGQCINRLLQFSGTLAADSKNKLQLSHWEAIVKEYFTNKAQLKFTLWKDNQRIEAKPFEIGVAVLPRFFLVTSQSGVKSMSFNLDGARERLVSQAPQGHGIVECINMQWTYRYQNGYTVTLRGPFTAHVVVCPNPPPANQPAPQHSTYTLKIDSLQFDATHHDKLLSLDAILGGRDGQSPTPINTGPKQDDERRYDEMKYIIERVYIPAEPVNAFGIPQATMRCLELAESVAQMSDLIEYADRHKLGPRDALFEFAHALREEKMRGNKTSGMPPPNSHHPGGGPSNSHHPTSGPSIGHHPAGGPPSVGMFNGIPHLGHGHGHTNGVPVTPPVALYAHAPSTSAASAQPPPPRSPQNAASSADAAAKQSKATTAPPPPPPSSQPSSSTPASASGSTPAAAATPAGPSTTPSMSNATLKRKAPQRTDTMSPSNGGEQSGPPAKRVTRKRGRTQGG